MYKTGENIQKIVYKVQRTSEEEVLDKKLVRNEEGLKK